MNDINNFSVNDFIETFLRGEVSYRDLPKYNFASCFFRPFNSKRDVALRALAIATGPIICSLAASAAVLYSGYCLLAAIKNTLTGNFPEAKKDLIMMGAGLFVCNVAVIAALLSPLVSLIDFIGTILAEQKPETASLACFA